MALAGFSSFQQGYTFNSHNVHCHSNEGQDRKNFSFATHFLKHSGDITVRQSFDEVPSGIKSSAVPARKARSQCGTFSRAMPAAVVQTPPRPSASPPPNSDRKNEPRRTSDRAWLQGLQQEATLLPTPVLTPREPTASSQKLPTLVLMRHGESMWNDLKLFTGDVDIPLTEKGSMEALAGGRAVADIDFEIIFTSRLVRSKQTALLAMTQNNHKAVPVIVRGGYHGNGKTGDENRLRLREAAALALEQAACRMVPVYADKALNERCYGDLQGLNKEAAALEFGHDKVQQWRRSHTTRPPHGESLMDTWQRATEFFESTIKPRLGEGNNVLVVAHGNVLRCIISHINGLSEGEMLRLQIVTALPYTFEYKDGAFEHSAVPSEFDPITNEFQYKGLASGWRKSDADSLI